MAVSTHRADAAVILIGSDAPRETAAALHELARLMERERPVMVFTAANEAASPTDGNRPTTGTRVSGLSPRDLAAELRGRGVIRPIVIAAGFFEAATACFASRRLIVPTQGAAGLPRRVREEFDGGLSAADGDSGATAARWLREIEATARAPMSAESRVDILVLYDAHSVHVGTIVEHLESFAACSRHRIWYAHAANDAGCDFELDHFDAVVIHYSCRVCFPHFFSPVYARKLAAFAGLKVLFIQDEYDSTRQAQRSIREFGIQVVFTCVPAEHVERIYPRSMFPAVRFVETLTGYIPRRLEELRAGRPMGERPIHIAYRGRSLGYWYGKLGREKVVIGERMRAICRERGVPCDIEWEEGKRIYGDAWYEFVASARATLGTESGSNLFDWDGEVKETIVSALAREPGLTFDEAWERYLKPHDDVIRMNQISPRIFEAIALRTGLILFEGTYSGIVKPHEHFIPLKKDFSNVDEVLATLADDEAMTAMTERAYADVVASGRYTSRAFVRSFDAVIDEELGGRVGRGLMATMSGFARGRLTASVGPGPMQLPALEPIFSGEAPKWVYRLRMLARRVIPHSIRRRLKAPVRHLAVRVFSLMRGGRAGG